MSVPGWMLNPKGRETPVPEEEPASKPRPEPAAKRTAPREAIISTDKGRLRLSLNYISCMVAASGLVVLLLVAFWLGRATAGTGAQTPRGGIGLPAGEGAPQEEAAREQPELPQRTAGMYYMVIQDLKGDDPEKESEAERIAKFSTDNGEPATVNMYYGSILVWSLKPFNKEDTEGTRNHALLVEEIGKRYFERYRTYDFRQRRQLEGDLDPLVLPYLKIGQ